MRVRVSMSTSGLQAKKFHTSSAHALKPTRYLSTDVGATLSETEQCLNEVGINITLLLLMTKMSSLKRQTRTNNVVIMILI